MIIKSFTDTLDNRDTNIHRALHNKNADGRSPEIEDYIRTTVNYFIRKCRPGARARFFDIGADYGFAMHIAKTRFLDVHGVEPYPHIAPIDPMIRIDQETMDTLDFAQYPSGEYHVFINHVLEHLENPMGALKKLSAFTDCQYLFISTPNGLCQDMDWVFPEGHLHSFIPEFFSIVVPRETRFKLMEQQIVCFRNGWEEIWNVYQRKAITEE